MSKKKPFTAETRARLDKYKKNCRRHKKVKPKPAAPLPVLLPGSAPRFFGYSRVSTQDQADNGTSLQRQETNLQKVWDLSYRETHEWMGVFKDEAVSGSVPFGERAEGRRLLLSVQKGDTIAFASLDRAFRHMADGIIVMTELDKKGVIVIVLNLPGGAEGRPSPVNFSTPMGRLFMQLLMAFAEFERHSIMERTHVAIRAKRLVNPWSGVCPYGMKRPHPKAKWFTPDPAHREWVRAAMKLANELGLSPMSFYLRHALKDRGMYWYARDKEPGRTAMWVGEDKPPTFMPSVSLIAGWIANEKAAQKKEAAGLYLHKRGCWRKMYVNTPAETAAGIVELTPVTEVA